MNIGDQFSRASVYGRYRVIPLHAEIVCQCTAAGFDYMGSIIWRKKTTMNTTGGAVVMGSYPYPPNGIVEIDFEYILLFEKAGKHPQGAKALKEGSAMSRDEWKSWFSGHWDVGGAKKKGHEAPFPEEIPRRLIRMFSFPGDTVPGSLPGTGTTATAAMRLGRNAVGYEISPAFVEIARASLSGITGTDCVVRETAIGATPRPGLRQAAKRRTPGSRASPTSPARAGGASTTRQPSFQRSPRWVPTARFFLRYGRQGSVPRASDQGHRGGAQPI